MISNSNNDQPDKWGYTVTACILVYTQISTEKKYKHKNKTK